jgi:hypothetical protein
MEKMCLQIAGKVYSMLLVLFVLDVVNALPDKKISCIKIVRSASRVYQVEAFGLRESKDLVEWVMENTLFLTQLHQVLMNAKAAEEDAKARAAFEAQKENYKI